MANPTPSEHAPSPYGIFETLPQLPSSHTILAPWKSKTVLVFYSTYSSQKELNFFPHSSSVFLRSHACLFIVRYRNLCIRMYCMCITFLTVCLLIACLNYFRSLRKSWGLWQTVKCRLSCTVPIYHSTCIWYICFGVSQTSILSYAINKRS